CEVTQISLVSQVWQGIKWEHDLVIFRPKDAKPGDKMLLLNSGGKAGGGFLYSAAELAQTPLATPTFPVICNLEARAVSDAADIRRTLEHQVTGSVRWAQSMQALLAQGHDLFLELGPGGQLAGMLNRIQKGVTVFSISDTLSLDKAAAALEAV
ncbi:MAG: hypothetical protein KA004_17990, partial [Verrucomicrobiales bacterium]|nr:hypothetical protein [Verrucomicrobiales bacterium]